MTDTVDLYAGPGGWDHAARQLGLDPIGIELDSDTCATRAAAGLTTIQTDALTYGPHDADGLIASPPCQIFSAAGSRDGEAWVGDLAARAARGVTDPHPAAPADAAHVLRPLAWVNHVDWIALEQVPALEPVWAAIAHRLRHIGWSAWSGVLNAADYGVPQTRRRSILIAHRHRTVTCPPPTHTRNPQPSLLEPLHPWVTMADALHLESLNTGRDWKPGGTREDAQTIPGTQPAPTVTTLSGNQWHLRPGSATSRAGEREHPVDGPAPTLAFGKGGNDWAWQLRGSAMSKATVRALDGKNGGWVWERPATTVAGDPRVWPPGHKINQDDIDRLGREEAERRYGDRAGTEAIRLTVEQAAILQTFPPDYPFQGSKTSKFRQIGNAVPPRLACHILQEIHR